MAIVFDIGEVLIAWDPHAAFRGEGRREADIAAMLAEVDFHAWNLEQDRGRSRADAVAAIAASWPQHATTMDGYFDRFGETIRHKIDATWDILRDLRAAGHRTFALTNWGADTWRVAQELHPELAAVFDGIVVSAHEGVIKPDRAIFDLMAARYRLDPGRCLFIDDKAENVAGARAAGWQGHHFVGATALRAELVARGAL